MIDWYVTKGLTPYQEKCGGRANVGARMLTFEDIQRIVAFNTTFAEEFATVLPVRIPGFKQHDVKLLPLHETKRSVWRKYKKAMEQQVDRAAQHSSFLSGWQKILPFIVYTKPMSDLCWVCQHNTASVYKSSNLPEIVKKPQS